MSLLHKLLLVVVFVFLGSAILFDVHSVFAWSATTTPLSYQTFATGTYYPFQMVFDSSGNMFAAAGNHVITKYDSNGNVLTSFNTGPFDAPTGVAIDSLGRVLSIDFENDKVDVFTQSGTFITTFGSYGNANGQFYAPYGAAVDSQGYIYITDGYNNRVQKYNSSYNYVSTISGSGSAFNFPEVVAVDSHDNVFVCDSGNNRVQEFDSSGNFVREITAHGATPWNYPEGMTVDRYDNLYVVDSGNSRIQTFDSTGTYQQEYGSAGTNLGQFNYPTGIVLDSTGSLYVGDATRIQKWTFDRQTAAITINPFAGNNTTDSQPIFTGIATHPVSTFISTEYSLDGGSYSACTADDGAFDELSETFTCTAASPLADGSHTVAVRATDSHYNTNSGSSLATYSFTINGVVSSPTPTPYPTSSSNPGSTPTPASPTPAPSPGSFPIISNADVTDHSVTLYFIPGVGPLTHYILEYGRVENVWEYGVNPIGDVNSKSFLVDTLSSDTTYYFRLTPVDQTTVGTHSLVFTTKTLPATTAIIPDNTQPVSTTTQTTDVTIVVQDINSSPIPDLTVTIASNSAMMTDVTDSNGAASFPNVPLGTYDVTIANNNGATSEQTLEVDNILGVAATYTLSDPAFNTTTPSPSASSKAGVNEFRIGSASLMLPVTIPPQVVVSADQTVRGGTVVIAAVATFESFVALVYIGRLLTIILELTSRKWYMLPFDLASSFAQWALVTLGLTHRKSKTSGTAFDTSSEKPLSGTFVVLFSPSGNLSSSFTDQHGRYTLSPVPDTYELRADKSGYIYPSMTLSTPSLQYPDLYKQGQKIDVQEKGSLISSYALALDPKESKSPSLGRLFRTLLGYIYLPITIATALISPTSFNIVVASVLTGIYLIRAISYHFEK